MCSLTDRASLIVKLAPCSLLWAASPPDFTQVVLIWVLIDSSNLKTLVPQNKKVNTWRHLAQRCALFLFQKTILLFVCFYHSFRRPFSWLTQFALRSLTAILYSWTLFFVWAASSRDRQDPSWGSCRVESIAREWPNELSWTNNWPLNGLLPLTRPFLSCTHINREIEKEDLDAIESIIQSIECATLFVRLQSAGDQFVCLIRQIASARSSFISFLCLLFFSLNQTRTHSNAPIEQKVANTFLHFYSYLLFFHNYRLCLFCQLASSVYKTLISVTVMFVCMDAIYLHSERWTLGNFKQFSWGHATHTKSVDRQKNSLPIGLPIDLVSSRTSIAIFYQQLFFNRLQTGKDKFAETRTFAHFFQVEPVLLILSPSLAWQVFLHYRSGEWTLVTSTSEQHRLSPSSWECTDECS